MTFIQEGSLAMQWHEPADGLLIVLLHLARKTARPVLWNGLPGWLVGLSS
jgi:hypothetical protein